MDCLSSAETSWRTSGSTFSTSSKRGTITDISGIITVAYRVLEPALARDFLSELCGTASIRLDQKTNSKLITKQNWFWLLQKQGSQPANNTV